VRIVTAKRNNYLSRSLTLRRYENYAWIPVVVVFVVVASVNGKHFVDAPVTPGTLAQISNFAVILSGQMLPWAALSSDYTVYFHPRVSRFVDFVVACAKV
jgi:purine-cytosine permease-like protein